VTIIERPLRLASYRITRVGPDAVTDALERVERARPGMSASRRLSRGQAVGSVVVLALVVLALVVWPAGTMVVAVSLCTFVYLATIAHRVVMVRSSLSANPFVSITDAEALAVPDHELPSYTLLVPAYREPEVMPALFANLERLDYPSERLEIRLLLEEGDDASLDAALAAAGRTDLPIEVIVLPPGGPQTKPRALNVGLAHSTGELVTIYDAEDRPEPLQLRRAAVAMGRLGPEHACLQARLEFYDGDRNLLTRWFAAEYLTWFNCFLPGMVNQGGVVPLGGTSNHFRRAALVDVGAWDPYNVTEDADLGIRLQRSGYGIGVLDSVTHEEANSDVINWIKQRSRWQKGYLATAFVHLRRPRTLVADLGWGKVGHLLLFVAGTPILGMLNLVFWGLSLLWIATQAHFIEQLFPGVTYYLALFAWAIGNFTILYMGLLTVHFTKRWELVVPVLLVPLYWVLMSIAALRAVLQFIVDPFHWEKTQHGLGFAPAEEVVVLPEEVVTLPEEVIVLTEPVPVIDLTTAHEWQN